MKKKILITGAGGFIAGHIAASFRQKEEVFLAGISSGQRELVNFDEVIQLRLGQSLNEVLKSRDFDSIIHCAFDKGDKKNTMNTHGTILWAKEAAEYKQISQIFLSSISSQLDSLSFYGKSKLTLEEWFISHGHPVIRLGLVVGNGGMFGRILNMVKKLPVLPLIGGGRSLIYLTDLAHITKLIIGIIFDSKKPFCQVCNLQSSDAIVLRDLIKEIKKALNKSCLLVPVPFILVTIAVKMIKLLRFIKIDLDEGNLKGLKMNQSLKINSHIKQLGYQTRSLKEMIQLYIN